MIYYGTSADHFFNLSFLGFKWPEPLIEVSGTVEPSCTGIELFFCLLGFDLLISQTFTAERRNDPAVRLLNDFPSVSRVSVRWCK